MRAFPKVVSLANRGPENTKRRCKPRIWFGLVVWEFCSDWIMFAKQKYCCRQSRNHRGILEELLLVEMTESQREKCQYSGSGGKNQVWEEVTV